MGKENGSSGSINGHGENGSSEGLRAQSLDEILVWQLLVVSPIPLAVNGNNNGHNSSTESTPVLPRKIKVVEKIFNQDGSVRTKRTRKIKIGGKKGESQKKA